MDILEVHQVTDELMAAFERLVPQLSSSGKKPSREAANRLYQRMGFQKRDTNSYRFNFPKEG